MKTVQIFLIAVATLGLAAAGCNNPAGPQISGLFITGPVFTATACRVRVSCRVEARQAPVASVTADLSGLGGLPDQALAPAGNDLWHWAGEVNPDMPGATTVAVTAVDEAALRSSAHKTVQVYVPGKAIAIAASAHYGLALRPDGTVTGWSFDDGSSIYVPSTLSGVTAISAGLYHSLALKSDGTVVAWPIYAEGYKSGQCYVPAGLDEVVAVSAGNDYSVALKADGTVVAWGGWIDNPKIFVLADVVAINRTVAVMADGTATCWLSYCEEHVFDNIENIVAASEAWPSFLALKSDGRVVQLDSQGVVALPVRVGTAGVTAIAAVKDANTTSMALQEDGAVVLWCYRKVGFDVADYNLVMHRLHNAIAIAAAALDPPNTYGVYASNRYMALTEDGGIVAWNETWSGMSYELPVPEELQ